MSNVIDPNKAAELFRYDRDTGKLYSKVFRGGVKAGSEVGAIHTCGTKASKKKYLRTRFNGKFTYVHRIIYVLMMGEQPETIDHIDGDGTNNRWDNLRNVPHRLNGKNQLKHKTNTSGVTGVCFRKDSGKWRARIMVDDKMINLGTFKTKDTAIEARREAEQKHNFYGN